jgi:hypothetical protein
MVSAKTPQNGSSLLTVNKLAPQTNGGLAVVQLEQSAHNSQREESSCLCQVV